RLARRDNADLAALRSQAARWAADNFDKLAEPDPKMPDLNDRAADNWRPLLAIADLAGGTWPEEGRRAACLLSGEEQDAPSAWNSCRISGPPSATTMSSALPTSWPSSSLTPSAPGPSGSMAAL